MESETIFLFGTVTGAKPGPGGGAWKGTGGVSESDEEKLVGFIKAHEVYFAVREYGTDGNNPHIHFVVQARESKAETRKRLCLLLWYQDNVPQSACLIKIASSPRNLVAGYLKEEKGHVVLCSNFPPCVADPRPLVSTESLLGKSKSKKYKHSEDRDTSSAKTLCMSNYPDVHFATAAALKLDPVEDFGKIFLHMSSNGWNGMAMVTRLAQAKRYIAMLHRQDYTAVDPYYVDSYIERDGRPFPYGK